MLSKHAAMEIMELLNEDYSPLFDVIAIVNKCHPNYTIDMQISAGRKFIKRMLSLGYVKLYYDCQSKSHGVRRHVQEINGEAIALELANRSNWLYHNLRPPDERWVTVAATSKGEQALISGEFSP